MFVEGICCYMPFLFTNLSKMNKAIKDHLKNVTVANLKEFRNETFVSFASLVGRNGRFEIGADAFGRYVVKHNDETLIYCDPESAVEMYHELVS
jgi:hypothetical protein